MLLIASCGGTFLIHNQKKRTEATKGKRCVVCRWNVLAAAGLKYWLMRLFKSIWRGLFRLDVIVVFGGLDDGGG